MDKRKICVVTGTRADYGLLFWIMRELQQSSDFQLQIIATGMHLSPEFGLTYRQIEEDGFQIDAKVEMLLSSDTSVGITKSVGLATIGFADAYDRLKPDLVMLLGDRFEMFAAGQAAMIANLPIAHLYGGDRTEGAIDEAIRHALTKMAHIHFTSNSESARRVEQMGENPEFIYNYGSTGIDYIKRVQLMNREQLEQSLNYKLRQRNFLVTFHPVTIDNDRPEEQFRELLYALNHFMDEDTGIIITKPNADTNGRKLISMIDSYVNTYDHVVAFTSLGQLRYLSIMALSDVIIGNSSSGLYEAPSFKKPTVNIGDRQKGRLQGNSIINCMPKRQAIIDAINQALEGNWINSINPYGDGNTSPKIIQALREIPDFRILLRKHFFEVNGQNE